MLIVPSQLVSAVQNLVSNALSAMAEGMGYPKLAKLHHQRLGTFESAHSRVVDYNPFDRHWASDVLLDHIHRSTERFRDLIAAT